MRIDDPLYDPAKRWKIRSPERKMSSIIKVRKYKLMLELLAGCVLLGACRQISHGSNPNYLKKTPEISTYAQPKESFAVKQGAVLFDTLPSTLTTHKIIFGNKYVFIYKRTGVTMLDAYDWEAKYMETLIFQIDTSTKEFQFCDRDLRKIDCRYYWVCLATHLRKEIRKVKKGCIKGTLTGDSVHVSIKVDPEFSLGGAMKSDNSQKINFDYDHTLKK